MYYTRHSESSVFYSIIALTVVKKENIEQNRNYRNKLYGSHNKIAHAIHGEHVGDPHLDKKEGYEGWRENERDD